MPTKPPTPCRHPGCPALVYSGGYCPQHIKAKPQARRLYDETTRRNDPALAWAAQVRNSSRWQTVRRIQMQTHSTCFDPFKDHSEYAPLARIANHIIPLRVLFETGQHELAYDLSNLASLCTACDARVGAMERRGEDTRQLFKPSATRIL